MEMSDTEVQGLLDQLAENVGSSGYGKAREVSRSIQLLAELMVVLAKETKRE